MNQFDIRKLPQFEHFRLVDQEGIFFFLNDQVQVKYDTWEIDNHVMVHGFVANGIRLNDVTKLKEFLNTFERG